MRRLGQRNDCFILQIRIYLSSRNVQTVMYTAALGLILPGIKVLITLGLITLGSNLCRVIPYVRINCRLR